MRHPPVADLEPAPKPVLDAAALTSPDSTLLDQYDTALDDWANRSYRAQSRVCWWFKDHGVSLNCGERPVDAPR